MTATPPDHPDGPAPQDAPWRCYILLCSDATFYTGVTNDIDKRLAAHNAGTAAKYTRGRGPVELAFVEVCADRSAALKREMAIKSMSRAEKLELVESRKRGAAAV